MLNRILMGALGLLALGGHALAHEPSASARYVGNEGVLVSRGDTKVIFDAFYSDSYGQYSLVPDSIRADLLAGTPPYDGIDAVFVSHVHGDHFSAAPAVAFMRAHKTVPMYASKQTYDALLEEVGEGDPLLSRVIVADLTPTDAAKHFEVKGLQIEVVSIPHAGGPSRASIQNLSWRVTLDDKTTVVHFGDAGIVEADFEPHARHFAERRAAAAFPPYWFFGEEAGKAIIARYFNADQVVGIHVPASATGHGDEARRRLGGDVFTDPGETRQLESSSGAAEKKPN
ncbi:MBL fold metallo-hydrolase [Dokdonella sp.]|uniref:MBL fold metallo-hydrolase n=1 Tax=Dokdonella sp. TaxID=2291710 RepID=UPI003C5ACFC6